MSRHTRPGSPNARRGFTLVEMLVVIVIIGMLAALLVPAVQAAREAARRANCIHNQGEIAKALLSYELSKKHFPGYANRTGGVTSATGGTIAVEASWPVVILKELDRIDLWDEWREGRAAVLDTAVDLFVCPSDHDHPEDGALSYVANCGQRDSAGDVPNRIPPDWSANGVFHRRYSSTLASNQYIVVNVSLADVKDGAQHTLLISENVQARQWRDADEKYAGMIWCPDPASHAGEEHGINTEFDIGSFVTGTDDEIYHHARPSSYHPGGVVAAYCDGSTSFLSERISYLTFQLLMTPDGKNAKIAGVSTFGSPLPEWNTKTLTDEDLNP